MSDIVVPRTKVLPLSDGRSITVHEELNHGQHIAMLARVYRETEDGALRRNLLQTSDALVIAYLVDWTLTDPQGQRIEVRGLKPDDVQDVLNNLRIPVAVEVKRAVHAYDATVNTAADEQKKTSGSDVPLPQTLQSVA